MPRRIVSANFHGGSAPPAAARVDGYFDRIIKYIPADVVGAWVAVTGIIGPAQRSSTVLWIAFAFGTIFSALWTWKQTAVAGQPPAITQIAVATVAFAVWVFALGGPFASLSWYEPLQGSLALIGYTLMVGLVVPKEP